VRGRLIQLFVKVAVLAALVWVTRRALVRWVNGPEQLPSPEAWPPLEATGEASLSPRLGRSADGVGVAGPPAVEEAAASPGSAWLAPDESGSCPTSHPVKAKRSTRLYREPGTPAYDRARPDRCYSSAAAAEADGFTRAKR
jgi:hypothetical protein